ncbi:MAG: helix-turn-helix domain-containing protein [Planctomycetota bacterium]|nr:helix-turn-helix domain-containing protein [Planctomycetota bacterium]
MTDTRSKPTELSDIVHTLRIIDSRLVVLERTVNEIHDVVQGQRFEKEWYTTTELAEILGKSQFTIQERWCNDGRIECEKDPTTGRWRIPGHEVHRLRAGGGIRPRHRTG